MSDDRGWNVRLELQTSLESERAAILVEIDRVVLTTDVVAWRKLLHALRDDVAAENVYEARVLRMLDPDRPPIVGWWGDQPPDGVLA